MSEAVSRTIGVTAGAESPEMGFVPNRQVIDAAVPTEVGQSVHETALSEVTDKLRKDIRDIRIHKRSPLATQAELSAYTPKTFLSQLALGYGQLLGGEVEIGSGALTTFVAAGYLAADYAASRQYANKGKAELPEGYNLQCLKLQPATAEDSQSKVSPVAVAVLSPYETADAKQSDSALVRQRLKDALRVGQDSGADQVLIPGKILVKAHSGLRPNTSTQRVVGSLDEPELNIASDRQPWLKLSTSGDAVKRAIELLDKEITPWDLVLEGLRARYPMDTRFQSNADSLGLLPILQGYAFRAMDAEVLGADRVRVQEGLDTVTRRVELTSSLNTKDDSFDPGIQQHAPGKYDPHVQRLSSFLGTDVTPEQSVENTIEKLEQGQNHYSETELLYTALQILREQSDAVTVDRTEQAIAEGQFGQPEIITLSASSNRKDGFRKLVAKTVMASGLAAVAGLYANQFIAPSVPPAAAVERYLPNATDPNISSVIGFAGSGGSEGSDTPDWAITPHGLQTGPYYTTALYNRFNVNTRQWEQTGPDYSGSVVSLPEALPDPETPHTTVWRWLTANSNAEQLPFAEGTKIAALSLRTQGGKQQPSTLFHLENGTYLLMPDGNFGTPDKPLLLSYQLVETPTPEAEAVGPISFEGPVDPGKIDPWLFKIAQQSGPAGLANYTRNTYQYSNAPAINSEIAAPIAALMVDNIDAQATANCNLTATEIAITSAAAKPDSKLAYTVGFYANPKAEYLSAAHAWVTAGDQIVDGTPPGQASGTTSGVSPQELDKNWRSQLPKAPKAANGPEHSPGLPNPEYYLIALGGILLAAAEMRTGALSRLGQKGIHASRWHLATRELTASNTYKLLAWQAYGGENSPPPKLGAGQPDAGIRWDNIPDATLSAAAKRGLNPQLQTAGLPRVQQRSVRRTAKFVAKDRFRAAKRAVAERQG